MHPKFNIGDLVYTIAITSGTPPSKTCDHCGHTDFEDVYDDVEWQAANLKLLVEEHKITGILLLGPEHGDSGVHYAFRGTLLGFGCGSVEYTAEATLYATRAAAEVKGNQWLEEERKAYLNE